MGHRFVAERGEVANATAYATRRLPKPLIFDAPCSPPGGLAEPTPKIYHQSLDFGHAFSEGSERQGGEAEKVRLSTRGQILWRHPLHSFHRWHRDMNIDAVH